MELFTIAGSIPLRHNPPTIAILLTAYLTVLVAGVVGNVAVIIVVVKTPRMKTTTNYFIVNRAFADLLVLIVCLVPNMISNIYVPWVMGSLLCKAVPYTQGVAVCASVYSLAAILGERFMAIGFPLRCQVRRSAAWITIVLIWIWAAGLSFPWLLYFRLSHSDRSNPSLVFCVESWPSPNYGDIYFGVVNLGLFFLVPLGFITFCQWRVWFRVKHRRVPTDSFVSQMKLVHQRTRASVQKKVLVVVAGFVACWLPLYVIFVRIRLIPVVVGATEEQVLAYAVNIAQWLGSFHSCLNPILHAVFNRNFRCAFRRLLQGPSAHTIPENRQTHSLHDHPNQRIGCKTQLIKLSNSLDNRDQNDIQLKISRRCSVDPGECNVNTLHPKNRKFVTLLRSKSL